MSKMDTSSKSVDLLIAGGGYVGLSLAVACKQFAPHLDVVLVDPSPVFADETHAGEGTRAFAIASAAENLLRSLGVWDKIADHVQPINDMIITDSRTQDVSRPVFLTFGQPEEDDAPFAHMVPNGYLVAALAERARALGVQLVSGTKVADFEEQAASMLIRLDNGSIYNSHLLVAADGMRSSLRALAGIKTVSWSYNQSGIVCVVEHELPHEGRAVEHFLPSGPFAILPLKGNRSSLVWTEETKDAQKLIDGDDFVFELELERRFGGQLGALNVVGGRKAFPLNLVLSKSFVAQRFALAGDAAHGVHPIAGQGLNLGFKDVATLAETIVDADRLGLDIGSLSVLEGYEQRRRFDTWMMGAVTDSLNRLFSNKSDTLRLARTVGLGLVDRMPALKSFFIGAAAGKDDDRTPRLMLGRPL